MKQQGIILFLTLTQPFQAGLTHAAPLALTVRGAVCVFPFEIAVFVPARWTRESSHLFPPALDARIGTPQARHEAARNYSVSHAYPAFPGWANSCRASGADCSRCGLRFSIRNRCICSRALDTRVFTFVPTRAGRAYRHPAGPT